MICTYYHIDTYIPSHDRSLIAIESHALELRDVVASPMAAENTSRENME